MVMLVDMLLDRLNGLSWIEFFTFAVNAFVFIFSKSISKLHGEDDESKTKTRLRTLHSFNLVVFAAFIASLIMNNSSFPDEQITLRPTSDLQSVPAPRTQPSKRLRRFQQQPYQAGYSLKRCSLGLANSLSLP